jgi:transposase
VEIARKAPFKATRRIIAFDEFGPLEIRPHHGTTWAAHQQVLRLPATYTRPHGTRYFLAAYDLHADHLWGWQRPHQRWPEVQAFLKGIRRRYPLKIRLFMILDNRRSHKKQEVLDWAHEHNVRFLFTPTYCSWLNPIECQFTPLKKFALSTRYFADHPAQGKAIQAYLRYRNQTKVTPILRHRDIRVNLA